MISADFQKKFMTKSTAESSNALSIFWLNKHGYLDKDCSYKSVVVTWTSGFSENKSSIDLSVIKDYWGTPEERPYIKLKYTHTSRWTNEKSDMDFEISLTTTPCKYGGVRYWFICPLFKSGRYCGRRVGVTYSIHKRLCCRYCGDIAYAAQMNGGKYRMGSVSLPDVKKAGEEVKRYYYNGKPTRKYRRFLRLKNSLDMDFVKIAARSDKGFARLAGLEK